MSLRKILETFIRFFLPLSTENTSTCPLSSCSNKNDGPRGRFNCISTVSCKRSVCVEVLTSFYGRFFVEEGQFIKYTPATSSLYLGSHFFNLLTLPHFGALNLPEVNQFTGNCFHMVHIVLKITSLKLRHPKGVTGRLPLCPIMALGYVYKAFYPLLIRRLSLKHLTG